MDAVEQEILRHTPPPITAREQRDSLERRSRILQYAYGTAGDIDIAASRPTREQIQQFITNAEQKEQELRSAIEQQTRLRTGRSGLRPMTPMRPICGSTFPKQIKPVWTP